MIQRLVDLALKLPGIVLALMVGLICVGGWCYHELDIEAYPNPIPPMVEVITQPDGWSAEEVERYVTVPLEVGLAGMPGLDHIRSQSLFGLSDIKCYFKWGTNYQEARKEVVTRLQFIRLPNNNQAMISPWNAIGEIYRYTLQGKNYTLQDLKTAQEWILQRQFKQVPGVIDVTSFGGEEKQYQVGVDPYRLRGYGLTLTQLTDALQNANQNVGGQRVTFGEQSYDVRGIGLFKSVQDISDVVISERHGAPIRVRDVARVAIGPAPRLGKIGADDTPDVVQGIVLMRYGAETPSTLKGVHERVEQIRREKLLPPGMEIKPYYDRGDLVNLTTHTVVENVALGMALVAVILLLFLGHMRAAAITALTIPLALLGAITGLVASDTSANLLSLGAIDFGIVVDSAVIMTENVFRHLGKHGQGSTRDRILVAAKEVATPMAYSTLIIGISFLPLFTMKGVSGVIFAPMAKTYAYAIGTAIILALTVVPVLIMKLIKSETEEKENFLMRGLHRVYNPLFEAALRFPKIALIACLAPIGLCIGLFPMLGREFMPKLEEGNLWIRATLPMSVSYEHSANAVDRMRRIVRGCPTDLNQPCTPAVQTHPEVLAAVSQVGRPDDGTDVTGFFNIEIFAPLKPFGDMPRGWTKTRLTEELNRELQTEFPGVVFNFSQIIRDNVEESVAGVKGENSIKISGPDIKQNEEVAQEVSRVMSGVRGVTDLGVLSSLGQPNLRITPDRKACARYGMNTGDVTAAVTAAIGGEAITQVYEGERYFDLVVRWLPVYRDSVDVIRQITVNSPAGMPIPLNQIATIELADGPSTIYREDGRRNAPVKFSVRGRDLNSTIQEARAAVEKRVTVPYGVQLKWAGEMNELKEAEIRLAVIIPLTLLLITFLVYSSVKNWLDTLIVLAQIPVAVTGGLLALLLTGTHFSVSAAMGFISVFGIAIQDALILVTYFQKLHREGMSVVDAAREASEKRFRPVLMTTFVAMFGLLPAALSNGIGAQTQKPLAIVVIGGSLLLATLTRILQPCLRVLAQRFIEYRKAPPSVRSSQRGILA